MSMPFWGVIIIIFLVMCPLHFSKPALVERSLQGMHNSNVSVCVIREKRGSFQLESQIIVTHSGLVPAQNQYATLWTVKSLRVEVLNVSHQTLSLSFSKVPYAFFRPN